MAYTPPAGNALDLQFSAVSYTPTAGNAVAFDLTGTTTGTVATTLPFSASVIGFLPVSGPASALLTLTPAAAAGHGVACQSYTWLGLTGSCSGLQNTQGFVQGADWLSGNAVGVGHAQGAVSGTLSFAMAITVPNVIIGVAAADSFITAGGVMSGPMTGTADNVITFSADATGTAPASGPCTGSFQFSGSGVGVFGRTSAAAGYLTFTVASAVSHGRVGAVAGPIKLAASSSGKHGVRGAVAAPLFSASAIGATTASNFGHISAMLGISGYGSGQATREPEDICL